MDAAIEADRRRAFEEEQAREAARRAHLADSRAHLEKQMEEKEMKRFLEGQEAARREREMVDNLVAQVMEEDRRDAEERARKAEESKVRRCCVFACLYFSGPCVDR